MRADNIKRVSIVEEMLRHCIFRRFADCRGWVLEKLYMVESVDVVPGG